MAGEFLRTSKSAAVCSLSMAGPTIEWLEPKLPDLLKNGSGSLGSFTTDEGALEGTRLDLNSTEFSSFSGVRAQKPQLRIQRLKSRGFAEMIVPCVSGYFQRTFC